MSRTLLGQELETDIAAMENEANEVAALNTLNERLNALGKNPDDISEAEQAAALVKVPVRKDGQPKGSFKRPRVLTKGQQAFAEGLIEGKTMIAAYRQAYPDSKSSNQSISAMAHKLYRDERIQEKVRDAWERTAENLADDLASTKRYVLRSLLQIIRSSTNDNARIRALELMGKASGAFDIAKQDDKPAVTADQLKKELGQHLQLVEGMRVKGKIG